MGVTVLSARLTSVMGTRLRRVAVHHRCLPEKPFSAALRPSRHKGQRCQQTIDPEGEPTFVSRFQVFISDFPLFFSGSSAKPVAVWRRLKILGFCSKSAKYQDCRLLAPGLVGRTDIFFFVLEGQREK